MMNDTNVPLLARHRLLIENIMDKRVKTIILGFCNPDRGDDGVAWHVLEGIAIDLKTPI